MNIVKLIFDTSHRAFRVRLVLELIAAAVIIAAAVAPAAANKMDDFPDLVLYDGKISTVDANNSTVEAIAIRDGTIIARGGSRQVQALATKSTRLINLNGRRVLPGLIDGHLHGMRNAYHCFTQTVRLDLVTSRTEALAAYAAKAASLSAGRWIWTTSGGWNLNQLDTPVIFTFNELSAAAPNNPIWIQGGSGVTGTRVNQAALTALGLSAGSPGVMLDANGQPTGEISVPATTLANQAIIAQLDSLTLEQRAACLARFMREVNRRGMTAWKDAGGNQAPWGSGSAEIGDRFNVREPTMHLYQSGGFTVRIAYHDMSNYQGFQQVLLDTRTRVAPLGDDMFRYMGPGEDTMATDADYPDFTRYAASKRFSVETHVGNLDAILAGFEAGNVVYPISQLIWMIAHPENGQPNDTQLDRAAALGIGYHLTFSGVRNGQIGPRFRSTMESGVRMCLASDAMNVSPYAPFQNLWYVTTGQTLIPGVPGVPVAQRLTREEALRHATVKCAWFLGQEGRLGSLEVGNHADLIVLSDDYFAVADNAIKDIRSVLTVVAGRIVYADAEYTSLEQH
jgi:predicted amidohydrolase YtcJ